MHPRRPIKTLVFTVASAIILAFSTPLLAGTPMEPSDLAFGRLQSNLGTILTMIDELKRAQCLADEELTKKLLNLQQTASALKEGSQKEYSGLMSALRAPMEGNGRCDGAFHSVALESQKRINRTEASEKQLIRLRGPFLPSATTVASITLFYALRPGCSELIRKTIDRMGDESRGANGNTKSLLVALSASKAALAQFKEKNHGIAVKCGEEGSGTALLQGSPARAPSALPKASGPKRNSGSTITGEILNHDLNNPTK